MLKKQGLILIGVFLAVFWALHLTLSPDVMGPRTKGATLLGGSAFLLMSVSIILSTRASFLEGLFGGLDRMYQVHKICGVLSGSLVLIHFLAVPKSLPVNVDPQLYPLVPSAPLGMIAMILLVLGLGLALNRKIPYNKWRNPHKVMALVYILILGHFIKAPTILFDNMSPSGLYLTGAGSIGVLCAVYSLFGMNRRTARRYEVNKVNPMERATEIILKPLDEALDFKPGQFAFIEVQGKGWSEPHPFTISSAPGEDRLRFTIKVLGDWTRKVREELKPGQEVLVRGPYGRFDMSAKGTGASAGTDQVWLAGGIGITPFLSNIRAMEDGDTRNISLVYAVREKDEALFLGEIEKLSQKHPNLRVVLLQSNAGEFARVDIMKDKLPKALTEYDYFLCGPKPMISTLTKDLKAAGVNKSRIHTEAFEFR